MTQHRFVLARTAALTAAPLLLAAYSASSVYGQPSPEPVVQPLPGSGADVHAPTTAPAAEPVEPIGLADVYESQSAGISFRPLANVKLVDTVSSKYLAEWSDPQRDWTLKLGKMVQDRPMPLISGKDNFGKPVDGVVDTTIKNLQMSLPGCKVLRQDVTNTRDGGAVDPRNPGKPTPNVGLIAIRYTSEGKRKLSQQAIIQANEGLYYLLTLTSPGQRSVADDAPEDATEQAAVAVFGQMLDSVRLLDRSAIKADQDTRLYRTRTAIVNFTASKLHNVLIPRQWVRILKNGKDVGFSFVTEEQAAGIPRPLTKAEMNAGKREEDLKKDGDGILIGVRARMVSDGVRADKTKGPIQADSASWYFVTIDKQHENFSRIVVSDDHKSPRKAYVQEFGVSEKHIRRHFERPAADPKAGTIQAGGSEPIPTMREEFDLDVSQTSTVGAAEPLNRKLPPWYLPQALSHLLPRLLPLNQPRGYLFATYVTEAREVMMRYVDVLPEQQVTFAGQSVRAIPIQDRLGLEGSITMHYMSREGAYLGSENKDQKLVMLPTDEGTLRDIWKDANLTRPGGVDRPGPAAGDQPAAVGRAPVIEGTTER